MAYNFSADFSGWPISTIYNPMTVAELEKWAPH